MKPIPLGISAAGLCLAGALSACSFSSETKEVKAPPAQTVQPAPSEPPRQVYVPRTPAAPAPRASIDPAPQGEVFSYDAAGNRIDRYGRIIRRRSNQD